MVHAEPAEIYSFLDQFDMDPGFRDFERRLRSDGVELQVVSDGLDFYIKYLLAKFGLDHLPVQSNIGHLEDHSITVEFPVKGQTCRRCGTCKGEVIERYRDAAGEPVRIAFVGDGYSDACAVHRADVVLAKKDLEQYCLNRNIVYTMYRDFFDVARILSECGFLPR